MSANIAPGKTLSTLFSEWSELRRGEPHLRAVDAARALAVSEAELVAARATGGEATQLLPAPAALLQYVAALGPVRAQSESGYALLESAGNYGTPDIGEHTGIVIGDNIDLRIFPSNWSFAFAVTDDAGGDPVRSIQVFDPSGAPAHKIFLRPESDVRAYERLVAELASGSPGAPLALVPDEAPAERSDAEIDLDAYRSAFARMTDTHDFFMLLRRFGLAREQGLRLAEPEFARLLAPDAHRYLFAAATAERIPLMLFVANDGIVQISSGPVPAATELGQTYALSDSRFNFVLREEGVARAWAVRKPTVNGIVTSLELYDAAGSLIVQVFGERHEGLGERPDWTRAVGALP